MHRFPRIPLAALCAATALLITACGGGGGYSNDPPPPPPPAQPTINLSPPPATAIRTTTLTANVVAASGVTRVEFLVDGTEVGSVTTAPYSFAWDTSPVVDGSHSLTARVTDQAGRAVTSSPVSVVVQNHPTVTVALSPDELFPRPTSTGSGGGDITFNLIDGAVTGGVSVQGMTATAATIRLAYAGAKGPGIINLVNSTTDPSRWEAAPGALLTAEQIDALLAGKLYVAVGTATNAIAEIRGQIKLKHIKVVFTAVNGASVVPPVTTDASGVAATTVDALTGRATVHVHAVGANDATEAHVHQAAANANNATALFALTRDGADAGHWFAELQAVTDAQRTEFTINHWYVDLHTPANPAGLIRGQITPSPPPAATLTQLQDTIFKNCADCHTGGGATLPAAMNLTTKDASFAALVNVASLQQPTVLRVSPGDPNGSYLIRKLEGTPGISGVRMPAGREPLTPATIDQVRSWINAGATNN